MKLKEIFTKELIDKIHMDDVILVLSGHNICQVSIVGFKIICDYDENGHEDGFVFDVESHINTDSSVSSFLVKDDDGGLQEFYFYEAKPYRVIPQKNTIGGITPTYTVADGMIGRVTTIVNTTYNTTISTPTLTK